VEGGEAVGDRVREEEGEGIIMQGFYGGRLRAKWAVWPN
jgi:hypothetical protein